jgi:hypothetical protein
MASNLIIKQMVNLYKVIIGTHLYPERVHVDCVLYHGFFVCRYLYMNLSGGL